MFLAYFLVFEQGFFRTCAADFPVAASQLLSILSLVKLSVKLDYACRALVRLAKRHASGEVSRIEELAEIEEIPANYLAQILAELRNGGLVDSRRGKQGGYLLARDPGEITLHEIISLVQGDLFSSVSNPGGASGKAIAEAWGRLQKRFEDEAKGCTLQEMAREEAQEMWYI